VCIFTISEFVIVSLSFCFFYLWNEIESVNVNSVVLTDGGHGCYCCHQIADGVVGGLGFYSQTMIVGCNVFVDRFFVICIDFGCIY